MDVAKALHRLWPACLLISVLACRPWAHGANQLPASDSLMAEIAAGRQLLSSGDYLQAEKVLQRALQDSKRDGDVAATALALDGLAGVYGAKGRFREAEIRYRNAIALLEENPQNPQAAYVPNILHNLAEACWQQGKTMEARRALERALRLDEANPTVKPQDLAMSQTNLARLLLLRGQSRAAEPLLLRAAALREASRNAKALALALDSLSRLYELRGDMVRAEQFQLRAARVVEEAGADPADRIWTLNNLGAFYVVTKRVEQGIGLIEQARHVAEAAHGAEHIKTLQVSLDLAEAYARGGRLPEAEALYRQTVARLDAAEAPHGLRSAALLAYARVLRRLDRKRDAAPIERAARDLMRDDPGRWAGYTVGLRELGRKER